MGIGLEKFDRNEKPANPWNRPTEVCVFNASGDANGAVIGGCFVYDSIKQVGKRWTVRMVGLFDP